jgi:hypothetical protein
MLVWGARSAADWAESGRDRRDPDIVARAQDGLSALLDRRGRLPIPQPFEGLSGNQDEPARHALFEAEVLRCDDGSAPVSAWAEAVELCERAGLRWDAEVARVVGSKPSVARGHRWALWRSSCER